jgi:hypothetical protein
MTQAPKGAKPGAGAKPNTADVSSGVRSLTPTPVNGSIIDLLTKTGWLAEADATDRQRVGAAVFQALDDAATREIG